MRILSALVILIATALGSVAAPPDVPETIQAQPGQLVRIVVKAPVGKDGKALPIDHLRNFNDGDAFWGELVSPVAGERHFVYQAPLKAPAKTVRGESGGRSLAHVIGFVTRADGESGGSMTTITVTYPDPTPPPAPVPPAPGPQPVDPAPSPVTSFRVVLVYESADTLTAAQRGVIYGKAVEDWLTANCTGGKNGWRRRDKDSPGDADPTMQALWSAVQPKVTTTPCIAVERNTKVEIIPLEATPAAMVTVLQTYRGK